MVKKMMKYLTVSTEYRRVTDGQTDRRTNGQTSCHGIVRAMHTCSAVKSGTAHAQQAYHVTCSCGQKQ